MLCFSDFAIPDRTAGELAMPGWDELNATFHQDGYICLSCRMLPHLRIHRGANHHRNHRR